MFQLQSRSVRHIANQLSCIFTLRAS